MLFAERAEGDDAGGPPQSRGGKKELYFVHGRSITSRRATRASSSASTSCVAASSSAKSSTLALAVLPRYSGRMGDTLISLGLVGPVDIFRAIRDQGRDRVADLFLWRGGQLTFYRGQTAPHVEFPLDLELPALMLAGLETAKPGDAISPSIATISIACSRPRPPRDDLFSFGT